MTTPGEPGPLPTTLTREVVEQEPTTRAALRATRYRLEQMRTAVIAARQLAKMVAGLADPAGGAEVNWLTGLVEAADRWQATYGKLADPPLEVEVEEDDEDDSHEGPLDVREEEHVTGVYLRTDGSLERQIGTIGAPEELPVLLHLAADEMGRHPDERSLPLARRERSAWTHELAQVLRDQTAVAPELLPGLRYAADLLDPQT